MKKNTLLFTILCATLFTWQGFAQFTESFDTGIPSTWIILNKDGGNQTWTHEDLVHAYAGDGHLRIKYESNAHEDYLISPQFTVTTEVSDQVEFYAGIYNSSNPETFDVKLSTTGTNPADFTVTLGSETENTAAPDYTKYSYDLSAYANQNVHIAIIATSTNKLYLYVDEFEVNALDALSTTNFETVNFTYFPNPVKDELTISAQKNIEAISIFNTLGQEVLHVIPSNIKTTINTNKLTGGTYIVKVKVENNEETFKIIKN